LPDSEWYNTLGELYGLHAELAWGCLSERFDESWERQRRNIERKAQRTKSNL